MNDVQAILLCALAALLCMVLIAYLLVKAVE